MRFALALFALLPLGCFAQQTLSGYEARPEVHRFIEDMRARHGFDAMELQTLFKDVRPQAGVLRAITPLPRGERSWQVYRTNFVSARRIENGARFWNQHQALLARAEQDFGVPAEIIVAIIGVETEYGRNMGSYRTIDALSTLAFDYPPRAEFFRGELEQLLLLARESERPATSMQGSYAGAIGIAQFMPGSIRRFATDYDGDGVRDLRGSVADAIGSVGSFLQQHGWAAGRPAAATAYLKRDTARGLAEGGVQPNRSAAELREAGVHFDAGIDDETRCVLIELESPNTGSDYLVGFHNFYVLTRYNRSSFYAASVLALAEAIKGQRTAGGV